MKKIACLLAGLLLASTVLASCGNIEMPPMVTTPEDTAAETTDDGTPVTPPTDTSDSDPSDPADTNRPNSQDTTSPDGSDTNPPTPVDPDHIHTFDEHWTSDDDNHWHASSCEHGDVIADKAPHADEDGNDVCDVCGFRKKHVHTYEDTWTVSESTHYHKNTCGHDDVEKYRLDEAKHSDKNNDALCDVCAYDYGHTHTYDTEAWTKTEDGHWHLPTCGHDIPGVDLTQHADADNDGICDGCGYDYDHTHTWSDKWTNDADYHWHDVSCGHSIPVTDKNAHVDGNGDKKCDECGYEPPHIHEFDTTVWKSDASGHWHASSCGHDVRSDETAHDGYELDGVCNTCQYVVFRFYKVNVTLPEESVSMTAPDGTQALSFELKEGSEVVFRLTLPRYIEIINMKGAVIDGTPVMEGGNHTYTVKIASLKQDTHVTMELKKNSNVQVIADHKEAVLAVTQKYDNHGQLTLNIPSAGRYIIYADNNDINFSLPGNEAPQDPYSNAYIFDAKAGELVMDYSCFVWSIPADNQVVFTYVLARVEVNNHLDSLEGNGCIMPTNYAVNLTFTLPSAGFYQIISSSGVSWNGDITQPYFFYVPEGGDLHQTIAIMYTSETETQFIFDWKIQRVDPVGELTLGENSFVAKKGAFSALTFTAPYDGSFHFTTGDGYAIFFHWVETEWGDYLQRMGASATVADLTAGDTIVLFVTTDPYAEAEEVPTDISCKGYASYSPVRDENGAYNAIVGVDNAFVSDEYEDIEYTLTATGGDTISIDGGQTWHTELVALVPGSSALYYRVKSVSGAETVEIHIGKTTYEFELTLGTNAAVQLVPDQEYIIFLTGAESQGYYANYILTWTDPSITVTYGGKPIQSGDPIDRYSIYNSNLTVIYNGDTEGSVVFTLAEGTLPDGGGTAPDDPEDPDQPDIPTSLELVIGENEIEVVNGYQGVTVTFTAQTAGTYMLSFRADVTNGACFIETDTGAEEMVMPYSVTLAAGETITCIAGTVDYMADTIYLLVSRS